MSYYTKAGNSWIDKDPNAVLDYSLDLAEWLADISDTLSLLTMESDGVTVNSSAIDGSNVVAWVSGGTVGEPASVTFRFTTTGGRTDDRTIYINIKER